jgi:hypothetical protein
MDWTGFIPQWLWDSGCVEFLDNQKQGKLKAAWQKAIYARRRLEESQHVMEVLEKKGIHA